MSLIVDADKVTVCNELVGLELSDLTRTNSEQVAMQKEMKKSSHPKDMLNFGIDVDEFYSEKESLQDTIHEYERNIRKTRNCLTKTKKSKFLRAQEPVHEFGEVDNHH